MTSIPNEEIVDYYKVCENDYRTFWDLDKSFAMHSGYWDEETKTLRDALKRENEVLAKWAQIKAGDRVLDAGCGVGGSSFYLQSLGCRVDGITISSNQVQTANSHAEKLPVEKRPTFHVMDYLSTTFEDETFDVVWACESMCHASDKEAFIRESYRILKKGGRLIVADGFSIKEGKGMRQWLDGWAVPHLVKVDDFKEVLTKTGYKVDLLKDITKNVMPSSRRLYLISLPTLFLSKIAQWLGLRSAVQTANLRAAYWHHKTLEKGLWSYQVVVSQKL
jgi:cyclopropane fatty-acyl-phospholipid synthase-like methyltransferase